MKIVAADGMELPWDGATSGDLLVRGPWVVCDYFRNEGDSPLQLDHEGQGWFPTGDVATIDADGFMQITDRSKDVIKSGGEWIGSIDLENIAMAHPAVAQAACVAAKHAKWDERPLLIVVRKPQAELKREELLAFYEGKIAKWWTPDDVIFVDTIPLGATGKVQKNRLREQFAITSSPTLRAPLSADSDDEPKRPLAGVGSDPAGSAARVAHWPRGRAIGPRHPSRLSIADTRVARISRPFSGCVGRAFIGLFVRSEPRRLWKWTLESSARPGDVLAARRRRERARERIIRSLLPAADRRVDLNSFHGSFSFLLRRKVLPERFDELVGLSGLEQDGDHGKIPVGVLVHEMGHHIGALAVDLFFAGLVEMKLNELVAHTVHSDETAGA
jgi:hypothetical protein